MPKPIHPPSSSPKALYRRRLARAQSRGGTEHALRCDERRPEQPAPENENKLSALRRIEKGSQGNIGERIEGEQKEPANNSRTEQYLAVRIPRRDAGARAAMLHAAHKQGAKAGSRQRIDEQEAEVIKLFRTGPTAAHQRHDDDENGDDPSQCKKYFCRFAAKQPIKIGTQKMQHDF